LTEQPNKNIKILIDRSEEIKAKDSEISRLNQELGKMQEVNKALLSQDAERERQKAEYVNSPRPAPVGGETANLENEPQYRKETFQIDWENSDGIEPSWIKGKNEAEVIQLTEQLAKRGSKMAQNALKTIARRSFKKGIDFQYEGNSLLFNKQPMRINEFDSEQTKTAKQAYNDKWLKNRVAFRDLKGADA